MTEGDRQRWAVRFGVLSGGSLGLLCAFAVAFGVDRVLGANPEWVLRLGSAAGMLGGGLAGRRIGAWQRGRLYGLLGAVTGVLLSMVLAILLIVALR
ncbi:MAG: hypothetical protein HYY06_17645 [Deltaproteobacteria bacterium]|nr:hypothetical protein [Deltaproteobacteria bacterium]